MRPRHDKCLLLNFFMVTCKTGVFPIVHILAPLAFLITSINGTYKNSACGSIKFFISHGQAILSTFGRSRVIHSSNKIFQKIQIKLLHLSKAICRKYNVMKRISSAVFSLNGFIPCFVLLLIFTSKHGIMQSTHTLLCLGDSYTIGEMVLPAENFPNQTVSLLRKDGYTFEDPEIVAKTGWTTDELWAAIDKHPFKDSYDFVTLLIGVNNQYRGRTVEDYKPGFESLLKQAIQFANGKAEHVIILSIPDWSVTPFAGDRDTKQI